MTPSASSPPPRSFWHRFERRLSRFLNQFMPAGVYERALVIVLVLFGLLMLLILTAVLDRHVERVTRYLSRAVAGEIALIVDLYQRRPEFERHQDLFELSKNRFQFDIMVIPRPFVVEEHDGILTAIIDFATGRNLVRTTLKRELERRFDVPFAIDMNAVADHVVIMVALDDRYLIRVATPYKRVLASRLFVFLLWLLGGALFPGGVLIYLLRGQLRPLQSLAIAARKFQHGLDIEDLEVKGASEIRDTTRMFLVMRERLEAQLRQRSLILAGVSHDLRTILTRFRLQQSLIKDAQAAAGLEADIAEMEEILESYLTYVRDSATPPPQRVILAEILDEAVAAARIAGMIIAYSGPPADIISWIDPVGLRRTLNNILNNAKAHADRITISVEHGKNDITIWLEDDGPGIASSDHERIFEPFCRLDNREGVGKGLGLAIARNIIRGYGGEIIPGRSTELGGLAMRIILPL